MQSIFFLKGLIIGFAMAVPIGPAGILCIRKTLAEGRSRGLIIGLGAATADMLCGSIAAFGLTVVADMVATISSGCVWSEACSSSSSAYGRFAPTVKTSKPQERPGD